MADWDWREVGVRAMGWEGADILGSDDALEANKSKDTARQSWGEDVQSGLTSSMVAIVLCVPF